jgi:hypothetical protein
LRQRDLHCFSRISRNPLVKPRGFKAAEHAKKSNAKTNPFNCAEKRISRHLKATSQKNRKKIEPCLGGAGDGVLELGFEVRQLRRGFL